MRTFAPIIACGKKMTPQEYVQLKAFSRVDGALLALLWTASFGCYVVGLTNGVYSMVAVLLAVVTPFFVARRLRVFRDQVLGGCISFLRGYAFILLTVFYAAVLFAVAQYVYMAYMDHGYLLHSMTHIVSSPEGQQLMEAYGLTSAEMEAGLSSMADMRPIDFALNVMTGNLVVGLFIGTPIAFLLQRKLKVE